MAQVCQKVFITNFKIRYTMQAEKIGKIIVIEGSDGSGKKTQTKLLMERLKAAGYKVVTMSFPQYDKPTGQKVRDYLDGKLGSLDKVDPKVACKLYADDRLAAKDQINKWLESGINIVFDRWMESNMAHQAAKFKENEREDIIDWIRNLEINQYKLLKSDLVIYLDLPVEYNQKAMEKEGRIKDIHESNVPYLLKVEDTYRWLASKNENWKIIDCLKDSPSGKIRKSIEEINDEIWNIIKPILTK